MTVKLLTEHQLEFLSLTEGCTGSSESTLVKMPHCLKSCVAAHLHLNVGATIRQENNIAQTDIAQTSDHTVPITVSDDSSTL